MSLFTGLSFFFHFSCRFFVCPIPLVFAEQTSSFFIKQAISSPGAQGCLNGVGYTVLSKTMDSRLFSSWESDIDGYPSSLSNSSESPCCDLTATIGIVSTRSTWVVTAIFVVVILL